MNCIAIALHALKLIGITLVSVPYVAVDLHLVELGRYTPDSIVVRNAEDCPTVAHEMVHHWQYLRTGWPTSAGEIAANEREARRLTALAFSQTQESY